jgi:hypothetical protein
LCAAGLWAILIVRADSKRSQPPSDLESAFTTCQILSEPSAYNIYIDSAVCGLLFPGGLTFPSGWTVMTGGFVTFLNTAYLCAVLGVITAFGKIAAVISGSAADGFIFQLPSSLSNFA